MRRPGEDRAGEVTPRRAPPWAIAAIAALSIALGMLWFLRGGERNESPRPGNGSGSAGTGRPAEIPIDRAPVEGSEVAVPELPPGPRIDAGGIVIDHRTGRGIAGAAVTITGSRDPRAPPLAYTRTDAAGVFTCLIPERERFDIAVRAEGYAPARWALEGGLTPEGIPLDPAALELEIAPESALWIRPDLPGLPPDENVIVEAQLRQARTPAELGEPLVTRESIALFAEGGRIGSLAMGQYLLSFRTSKQRLGTREVELGMGEERTVELTIGPPVPIRGTIRHNGRPVSGGRLVIWGREHASHAAAPVDERGGYEVSLPSAGSYGFAFTPSRRSPEDGVGGSRELEIASAGTVDLDFRSARLSGLVTGPGGEPIAELAGTLFGPQALSFVTDASGEFALDGVPLGVYRWLFPSPPPGCFGPAAEFAVEGETSARYAFEPAAAIEIRLTGQPDAVGEVGAPQVGLLAAGGEIAPLRPTGEPERWWWPTGGGLLVVQKRGYAPWFSRIAAGEHPERQVVELLPGGELTVTLFGEDGRPIGGHSFRIDPVGAADLPLEWCERRTGPRGSAVVALPPGSYRVRAQLPGGEGAEREIRVHPRTSTECRLP